MPERIVLPSPFLDAARHPVGSLARANAEALNEEIAIGMALMEAHIDKETQGAA